MSGSWAVVTGASSGLGVGYARHLAAEGVGVVLAARSIDKLERVAAQLRDDFQVPVRVLPVDLTDRVARERFAEEISRLEVSYLVNNAGFGTISRFADSSPDRIEKEIELDVVALTHLTRAVLPGMVGSGRGAIINVASTGAFQPIPTMAVYAASKAYVLRLTVALWRELKPTGVRALAICPGPTATEFFATAGDDTAMRRRRSVEQVVATTFDALRRHRPYVIDGPMNRALAWSTRLVPVGLQARLAEHIIAR